MTSEQLLFRINHLRAKLDLEKKVKTGTENLLSALTTDNRRDLKMRPQLEDKVSEANAKIQMLTKAEHKYSELLVASSEESPDDEILYLSDNRDRRTGRIIMKLTGAVNMANKKSFKDEMVAIVKVDGTTKHTSRATRNRWDENLNFQGNLISERSEEITVDADGPLV
jgi:hypothetical protein